MSGRDIVAPQNFGALEEFVELHETVALNARVGSNSAKITANEVIDYFFLKTVLKIKDVVRHFERI